MEPLAAPFFAEPFLAPPFFAEPLAAPFLLDLVAADGSSSATNAPGGSVLAQPPTDAGCLTQAGIGESGGGVVIGGGAAVVGVI